MRALFLVGGLALMALAQDLAVQKPWKILPIAVGADDFRADLLLQYVESRLEEEFPGLEIDFDTKNQVIVSIERTEGAPAWAGDVGLVRAALLAASQAGHPIADYDFCLVISPQFESPYWGYSHIDGKDAAGKAVLAGYIHSDPARILKASLLRRFKENPISRTWPWLSPFEERLRGAVEDGALDRLIGLPGVRELIMAPTVAHEFGHFLAPGDRDIRDGYQSPWIKHATSPDDNPDQHGLECVMHKGGPALGDGLGKLLATRGRLVVFCQRCKDRVAGRPVD